MSAAQHDSAGHPPDEARPDLFFLRHCQTEWNESKLYQGWSDPPLSESGIREAERLTASLANVLDFPFTLASSPLARAHMTAAIVAKRFNASIVIDRRLMELGYGMWEGHSQEFVKRRWPDMLRQWKRSPETVVFSGGDCLRDLQVRVRSFLTDVAQRSSPTLAVTHDGVIRIASMEALGIPLSAYRTIKTTTGSLTAFVRTGTGITSASPNPSAFQARSDAGETTYDAIPHSEL